MVSSKIARLVALTESQFTRGRTAPKRKNFKPLNVNATKLGPDWARERSAAARMMAIVVGDDSESLLLRVSADPETAATFESAIDWLDGEASYLRKLANRHETAASRIRAVIARYKEQKISSAGGDLQPA